MGVTKESLSCVVGEVLELPRWGRSGKAYKIVQVVFAILTKALQEGKTIKIDGFGIFQIRERAPTRSPCYYFPYLKKRGLHWEVKDLPAKRFVIFKPSKVLLQLINQGES